MEKRESEKRLKRGLCVLGLLLAIASPAMGQISFKTVDKHEQLKRKSLKEASKADASYKDTHLNMDAYTFKKGAAAKADNRPALSLLRPTDAPDKETVQRKAAKGERKFRLFRKKNKTN
ncbi:hypothetical protein [Pontibacter roseus]|uniref:hypothetical protein n=1 Tax=Pontibacter roseus TaxID=336989 RepID=UPI0003690C88|nr:hypothetical protein [Pontibacter roseus]